ncbi:MAG: sortase [Candidatus Roizmanbacteria bacterium]|nr:sortase [Candidatus Roizmanbacteria bacterium]
MKKRISNLFIIAGVLFLLYSSYLWYLRYSPNKLSFTSYPSGNTSQVTVYAQPVHLNIPGIGISTAIVVSNIVNDVWEISNTSVSYLNPSPVPGQQGNSILYGHNWTSILGNLPKTKPGETIQISFSDGTTKNFIVEYTRVVNPDEVEVIKQTEDIRITLYTCTGFLDSKRFVVVAKIAS